MKSGIYKIESSETGRIYIGSSSNIRVRWYAHKCSLNKGNHHSILLQRHVDKYTSKDLKYEILEECDVENLVEREQYYMDIYNPYFNILKIAESTRGYEWSVEQKSNASKIALDGNRCKTIYQYDLKGNFQKEWLSISQCARVHNLNKSHIHKCLRGEIGQVRDFIFKYYKLDKIRPNFTHRSKNPVLMLDEVTGEVLNRWVGVTELCENSGYKKTSICRAIKNNTAVYGFKWKYATDEKAPNFILL